MKSVFTTMMAVICLFCLGQASLSSAQEAATTGNLVVAPVEGETFRGKGTDAEFPRRVVVRFGERSTTLVALGSGVRKKMIFKGYEGIAYADESAALNADPYPALLEGSFVTRVVMYFLRDVGAEKIRGAWQDGFDRYLGEGNVDAAFEADKHVFLGYFDDTEVKKHQTIELTWLPGIGLFTVVAGMPSPPINNPRLAAAVFSNWFGEKPISGDLKKDMIRFLSE